jgi:transposase
VFTLTALEPKEAEMRIIGVDLHARQQTVAMLDTKTGELIEKTLKHDGDEVRRFYSALPGQVLVGIEATGSMHWFLELLEELGIAGKVGHPAKIRAAEPRKQKHDRRDAALLLKLQVENRFPAIWMPSTELRDLRTLLMHRHQWVRMRTRVQNALQAIALGHGLRRGKTLWSQLGQHTMESLALPPHAAHRRTELRGSVYAEECRKRRGDVVLWMPSEIPRRKERTGDQTFSVARRKKDHESREFASLDSL